MNSKICVPIQAKNLPELRRRVAEARRLGADMIEIWLDHLPLSKRECPELVEGRGGRGVLATCKTPAEGGRFRGSWADVARVLKAAAQWADYVDVPLAMPPRYRRGILGGLGAGMMNHAPTILTPKIILSHHDFRKTPSFRVLHSLVRKMRAAIPPSLRRRGDRGVVKIACMARSQKDALNLIRLALTLQKQGTPHIIIGMGPHGLLTRVLSPRLGNELMFAPVYKNRQTASGQLTVKELRMFWNSLI